MKCQSKHTLIMHVETCTEEATKKITITTFVPHLGGKKQVRTRCLCDFHAKRYRGKLNRKINAMYKHKSYVEESI